MRISSCPAHRRRVNSLRGRFIASPLIASGLLALSAVFTAAIADPGAPVGPVFAVSQPGETQDIRADIARNASGEFIVTWVDYLADNSSQLRGRLYSASGQPLGDAMVLAESPPSSFIETGSRVGIADDGSFVVAWSAQTYESSSYFAFWDVKVQARRFNPDGTPNGDVIMVADTPHVPLYAPQVSLAVNAAGEFTVGWIARQATVATDRGTIAFYQSLQARAYAADGGVKAELPIYTDQPRFGFSVPMQGPNTWMFSELNVALDAAGNSMVAWIQRPTRKVGAIWARGFDVTGAPSGPIRILSPQGTGYVSIPAVAAIGTGVFEVAMPLSTSTAPDPAVYLRRIDAKNDVLGSLVLAPITASNSGGVNVDIAATSAGTYVATWANGNDHTIYGQYYAADGSAQGPTFTAVTSDYWGLFATAVDAQGGLAVTWSGDYNTDTVFAQLFSSQ